VREALQTLPGPAKIDRKDGSNKSEEKNAEKVAKRGRKREAGLKERSMDRPETSSPYREGSNISLKKEKNHQLKRPYNKL